MSRAIYLATETASDFENFAHVLKVFGDDALVHLKNPEELIENPPEREAAICLVDARSNQQWAIEWVQTMRMTYEKVPIIVFHQMTTDLNMEVYQKNGANYFMHFYFDQEFIVDLIIKQSGWDFNGEVPLVMLQSIHPDDIADGAELNFDVYAHLPHNGKTIKLRKQGDVLTEQTVNKVTGHGQNVYFKKTDQSKFVEYAKNTQFISGKAGTGRTMGELNAKEDFYVFMSEFFDPTSSFDSGKKILETCKKIVGDMGALQERTAPEWTQLLIQRAGRTGGFYQRALNMAYTAAVMGHLVGVAKEKIEALALAGLLHNIGLSKVSQYYADTQFETMSEEQKKQFYAYPHASSTMVKLKKVSLSKEVNDILMQHRERMDGKGFPSAIGKDKFSELTFIFQIAMRYEELTSLGESGVKRTPVEAMEYLKTESMSGKEQLELTVVMKILKAMKTPTPAKAS